MSLSKSLPPNPNFEQLKKQAKELLKAVKAGRAEALVRFAEFHPEAGAMVGLSDAQLVLAREYDFASWAKLKVYVESFSRSLEDLHKEFVEATVGNNMSRARQLLAEHPRIAEGNFAVSLLLGDFEAVRLAVDAEGKRAVEKTGSLNIEPLLYLSRSRFHAGDDVQAKGFWIVRGCCLKMERMQMFILRSQFKNARLVR